MVKLYEITSWDGEKKSLDENHMCANETFIVSWLYESPQRLQQPDTIFDGLEKDIELRKTSYPQNIYDLNDGWFKYVGNQFLIYWFEENNDVILGARFDEKPHSIIVDSITRNPKYKNLKPYATDLYELVLKDQKKAIGLESDNFLSDSGFKIWARLLVNGHKIAAYDTSKPGKSFIEIKNLDSLKQYFGNEPKYRNYRYVLSEKANFFELSSLSFGRRKYKEINNLPLD